MDQTQGPGQPNDATGTTRTTRRFLVEVARPRDGYLDVCVLADRSRTAAAQVRQGQVRFIRAVAVPEDGSCLLLFEAVEQADVDAVVRVAAAGATVIQDRPESRDGDAR